MNRLCKVLGYEYKQAPYGLVGIINGFIQKLDGESYQYMWLYVR